MAVVGYTDLVDQELETVNLNVSDDHWWSNYKQREAEKIGDCDEIPGWDRRDCCASCHDGGRFDTDLQNVNGKRICCHAERWVKAEGFFPEYFIRGHSVPE